MDDKDKTLYAEENRQALIELNKGIENLSILINTQISNYKAPSDKMNVIGEVKVNTEKSVEISNLQSLSNDLKEFSQLVTQQTETIVAGIPQNVSINNLDDIKLESIKVSNINDIKEYFVILGKQIADNRPIVEVTQKELKLSTSPKDPIAVRLSDGKSFYNAIATAMSGGGGGSSFTDAQGKSVYVTLNPDGSLPVSGDPFIEYITQDEAPNATGVSYYGFTKIDGTWYIMARDKTSNPYTDRYANLSNNLTRTTYVSAWTNRAILSYDYIFNLTGV
jgi:hypothetical protein